jgi:aspartyl-tRNA(Asn)/glutamyl-tRNA(Gln) amidotransferase subunit B
MERHLEPVIGLEIHVQLKTRSKMFCGCPAHDVAVAPNANVCPVCLGQPGALPVPNAQAVRMGVFMGLALGCTIAPRSKFDRKNYFYPDLPKGYQISQFDLPIASEGMLEVEVPGSKTRARARIRITRAHLEEDAAKSAHGEDGKTYVDFNRAGIPLLETVTEPDFRTPAEAKAFLIELRLLARTLGVSDADMEKGHLRCDANVSLRELDENGGVVGARFNPKTEIKNLNSFKHVERALEYEILRQTRLWNEGTPPKISTTRGWNDAKGVTEEQRTKEEAADYRYFPEPDIPPLDLAALAEDLRGEIPELPAARRARFVEEYAMKVEDARQIVEDPALADYAERVMSELFAWLDALPEYDELDDAGKAKERARVTKLMTGWLLSKLGGLMAANGIDIRTVKIDPENFAEFITLLSSGKLSSKTGMTVLEAMLADGSDPTHVMEDKKLGRLMDEGAIAEYADRVIANFPVEVAKYQAGKKELLQFLIGQVLKDSEGNADPALTKNVLLVKLES